MKRKLLSRPFLFTYAVVLVLIAWFVLSGEAAGEKQPIFADVQSGDFEISVTTTGEIRTKTQTDIDAPGPEMQEAGLWNGTKIEDLVPEGTVVKAGEFVASLDKSALMTKLQEISLEFDKKNSELKQARLDTSITLRDARDELLNLKSAKEESRLELEQSAYEAPAIQRQKQLALEKADRNYTQKVDNYKTKVEQSATKVAIIHADMMKAQNSLNRVNSLLNKMVITAPKDGMVIYVKDWNGKKRGVGSTVNPWESSVATLPDLREMQVITYVNEVDIRKIKAGQAVSIKLDSDPSKNLKGVVVQVANIGEQRPNQDSKVFEVLIDVLTKDPSLRPSMTTSNIIHIDAFKNVLSVPLEAITTEKKHSYVWVKDGASYRKQEVRVGAVNDMAAMVYSGLKTEETVYLTVPSDTSGSELIRTDTTIKPPAPFIDKKEQELLQNHLKTSVTATKRGAGEISGGMTIVIE
jgi:multidrug efflux pump subunit AcrA (membrane-fusion protein)